MIRAKYLVVLVLLAALASCTSALVNPEDPSASLADDQAACDKQASEDTGQYNDTRAFETAKRQCMKDKGWKRVYDVAAW